MLKSGFSVSALLVFALFLEIAIIDGFAKLPYSCQLQVETGEDCSPIKRERYYFNIMTYKCHKFLFEGCAGNANRFHTKAECENFCLAMQDTSAYDSVEEDSSSNKGGMYNRGNYWEEYN